MAAGTRGARYPCGARKTPTITATLPDPDLLPLVIDDTWIDRMRAGMPELPAQRKARYMTDYGLPSADATVLTGSRELSDYFETCLTRFDQPKTVANWIMGDLLGLLNARGLDIDRSPISPDDLAGLLKLLDEDVISGKIAKTVFEAMAETGKPRQNHRRGKGTDPGIRHHGHRPYRRHPDQRAPRRGGALPRRQPETDRLFRRPGE